MVEGGGGTGVAVTEREVEETGEEEESGTQGAEAVGDRNSSHMRHQMWFRGLTRSGGSGRGGRRSCGDRGEAGRWGELQKMKRMRERVWQTQ